MDDRCPTCGKPMVLYEAPCQGDPGLVCLTDDAAHRAAADRRVAERVELLRVAGVADAAVKASRDAAADRERVRP